MALDDLAVGELDEVIHGRLRLGIMTVLAGADGADFNQLKARLGASDGNLSTHLRKLEDAGYLAIQKSFVDRKPLTRAVITPQGRRAFIAYLDAMEVLVKTARDSQGDFAR